MVGFTPWALDARREVPLHPFCRRMGCRSQSPPEGLEQAKTFFPQSEIKPLFSVIQHGSLVGY